MFRSLALSIALLMVSAVAAIAVTARDASAFSTSALTIYPLGDSITYGSTATWSSVPGGYRASLDRRLTDAGVAHHFVGSQTTNASPELIAHGQSAHDGHPGFRVDEVAAGIDGPTSGNDPGRWMTSSAKGHHRLQPDVVVIHLGTNDLLQHFDPARPSAANASDLDDPAERAQFVEDLTQRFSALLDKLWLLAPDATIVVATVIPTATGAGTSQASVDFAAAQRALVRRLEASGSRVVLADTATALTGPGSQPADAVLSADGVHPTPLGYRLMADVIAGAVEQAAHRR